MKFSKSESYFYRNVPEHERLVALKGSVIDYAYGGGTTPAVLIVMGRLQKDFHAAIRTGLDWLGRYDTAIDTCV